MKNKNRYGGGKVSDLRRMSLTVSPISSVAARVNIHCPHFGLSGFIQKENVWNVARQAVCW